jgi:5'-nucleotidase/UDP-sugar diphosphatase
MGREAKLLLALLATLAGVFLGVLSMKLLVPRPPAGAGPDVAVEVATTDAHDLVEPPSLSIPVRPAAPIAAGSPPADDLESMPPSAPPATPRMRDPFVAPAGLQVPAPPATTVEPAEMPTTEPHVPPRTDLRADPPTAPPAAPAAFAVERYAEPPQSPAQAASLTYVARAGDSWWNLAERAYGDGRLYRALFAWNRVTNPRVSLEPGTPLELPPRSRLESAWPKLMPAP